MLNMQSSGQGTPHMAIAFIRISFSNVRPDGGACEQLSYIGRCAIEDERLFKVFDFQDIEGDLVHSEIIKPPAVAECFSEVGYLANSLDRAAVRRLRIPLENMRRPPQNAMLVIVALPPVSELTLVEATELTLRTTLSMIGQRRMVAFAAIHDPALATPGARNRHGHITFSNREAEGAFFSGNVIRDLAGRPLQVTPGPTIIEGDRWPDFYVREQQQLFAELAIDLVVDPIAPVPRRHWSGEIRPDDPRLSNDASRTKRLSAHTIHDNPLLLINALLRNRATIRIAELQRLITKFIDGEADRQAALETILSKPECITFAVDPAARRPRVITTAAVYEEIKTASDLVDRAATDEARTIHAISVTDHLKAVEGFVAMIGEIDYDKLILLGNNFSESRALADAVQPAKPEVRTIKAELSIPKATMVAQGIEPRPATERRLLVVSRSELIHDQTLARLIIHASQQSAVLVLLHDQSRKFGVVSHRLASYAAERLAPFPDSNDRKSFRETEKYLSAGLIGPAIELLEQIVRIEFKEPGEGADELAGVDFVVCNDPLRVGKVAAQIRALHLKSGQLPAPVKLGGPRKPVFLSQGERIVFTRDDYSVRPPKIRAGEIAEIAGIDPDCNSVQVKLSGGSIETIDLKRFTSFRPAYALLVREAHKLDPNYRLRIEVSDRDRHHVWANLLLAVRHPDATLVIDTCVAVDIPTLIAAGHRSLPAALPHQLIPLLDPNSEIMAILNGNDLTTVPSNTPALVIMPNPALSKNVPDTPLYKPRPPVATTYDIEPFPEPDMPKKPKPPSTGSLHEKVRSVLDYNTHTQRGLARLSELLSEDNPDRERHAVRILGLCRENSPMATIVQSLLNPRPSVPKSAMAETDLPFELELDTPREWRDWDLYQLKIDLSSLQFSFSNWHLPAARARKANQNRPKGSEDRANQSAEKALSLQNSRAHKS
jgi:hypothetical protein